MTTGDIFGLIFTMASGIATSVATGSSAAGIAVIFGITAIGFCFDGTMRRH